MAKPLVSDAGGIDKPLIPKHEPFPDAGVRGEPIDKLPTALPDGMDVAQWPVQLSAPTSVEVDRQPNCYRLP